MTAQPLWYVGDQQPSIEDTITVGGQPVDLSAATVQFKMRAVGSSVLKVNQPVSFKDAQGNWRYDWGATDLDTATQYLAWVAVTIGGKTQTLSESLVEVRAHANSRVYVELEQAKSSWELTGTRFQDQDILSALASASRVVDGYCGRRFWLDADANQVRYYSPYDEALLAVDDVAALTSVQVDTSGQGTFTETWTLNTDFVLEPLNAAADGLPFEMIRALPQAGRRFRYPWRSVKVTAQFGWPAVPEVVKKATSILGNRYFVRGQQAPLGVVGVGADGAAVRLPKSDPDVATLLDEGGVVRLHVRP